MSDEELVNLAAAGLGVCSHCKLPWKPVMLDDCLGCGRLNLCPPCMRSHQCGLVLEADPPMRAWARSAKFRGQP